jgi:hypothetical protein
MPTDLHPLLSPLRDEGARTFAAWDPALFDAVAAGPASALADALDDQPGVLRGYLRLVLEAIGTGALRRAGAPSGPGGGWTTFLERCLLQLVPDLLPAVAPERRLPLLVEAWNLGEGLLREPPWVDRYVGACAARLKDLADLEGFLVRTLEPVLTPSPPSEWKGPLRVSVLDFRPWHEEFLPGELHLAAPTVLGVADRRLPGVQMGVLLRPGGQSEVLGLTVGLGGYAEEGERPSLVFEDQRVKVAGQEVALPYLRSCARHAVARAGFVAACAVDSQRLWIVESP